MKASTADSCEPMDGKTWDFTGTVKGNAIEGSVADVGGGTKAAWSAKR